MTKLTPKIVRQLDLHRTPKAVLLEVVFLANGYGAIRATQDSIGQRLGLSKKTVRRALFGLEEAGLIRRISNRNKTTGRCASDTIELVENAVVFAPRSALRQRDKMSPWNVGARGPECPLGQRDKMSPIYKNSFKTAAAASTDCSQGEDAEGVAARPLKLIQGGRK